MTGNLNRVDDMDRSIPVMILILALLAAGGAMAESEYLVDFGPDDRSEWSVINDGVMGGVSRGGLRVSDQETGVFSGELSLENNGGFASVRATLSHRDLSSATGLEIRVRGDGRTYQLRLRIDDRFDGIAYRTFFETEPGEWVTVRRSFDVFEPTFRGRTPRNAPPLDTAHIHQVGFMLADKQPGGFSLEIDYVRTWKDDPVKP